MEDSSPFLAAVTSVEVSSSMMEESSALWTSETSCDGLSPLLLLKFMLVIVLAEEVLMMLLRFEWGSVTSDSTLVNEAAESRWLARRSTNVPESLGDLVVLLGEYPPGLIMA